MKNTTRNKKKMMTEQEKVSIKPEKDADTLKKETIDLWDKLQTCVLIQSEV